MIERIFAGAAGTLAFVLATTCGSQVCQRVVLVAVAWRHSIEYFQAWSN